MESQGKFSLGRRQNLSSRLKFPKNQQSFWPFPSIEIRQRFAPLHRSTFVFQEFRELRKKSLPPSAGITIIKQSLSWTVIIRAICLRNAKLRGERVGSTKFHFGRISSDTREVSNTVVRKVSDFCPPFKPVITALFHRRATNAGEGIKFSYCVMAVGTSRWNRCG